MANVHDGHRKRVREKALNNGFDSFADHELLEMLLFYVIPRGDTNPIAHNLLNTFGSLKNLLDASVIELQTVDGIGENTAIYLSMFLPLLKRYITSALGSKPQLETDSELIDYLKIAFLGEKNEAVYVVYLAKDKRLIAMKRFAEGSVDSVSPYLDKIVEETLIRKAHFVVIAHNHPSGNLMPSSADIDVTGNLMRKLDAINKCLYDSLIFNNFSYHSMKETGYLNNIGFFNPLSGAPQYINGSEDIVDGEVRFITQEDISPLIFGEETDTII